MLITNFLAISIVIFALFQFITGFNYIINNPIGLIIACAAILSFHILLIGTKNSLKDVQVIKGSLIDRIKKTKYLNVSVVIILYVLAIGNFAYANKYVGTPIVSGFEYLEAVLLSFLAYSLLKKKQPLKI